MIIGRECDWLKTQAHGKTNYRIFLHRACNMLDICILWIK